MHFVRRMKTTHCIAATLILAAAPLIGCASQHNHDVVSPSSAYERNPQSRVGVTERQPSSEAMAGSPGETTATPGGAPADSEVSASSGSAAPAEDQPQPLGAEVGVRPDGTPVRTGAFQLPGGTTMTSSVAVGEIRAFPEEVDQTSGNVEGALAVGGTDRVYQSTTKYRDAVGFFDELLSKNGFQTTHRKATKTATLWAVQSPGGGVAHIAVRDTKPITIEIVEANAMQSSSSAQPPSTQAPPTKEPATQSPSTQAPSTQAPSTMQPPATQK
jgi:hypothetical protein